MTEPVRAAFSALGAVSDEDAEARRKRLLLLATSLLILPAALVWGTLYLVLGRPDAATLPYAYFAVSVAGLLAFATTRKFYLLRRIQLANILVVPALLSVLLGGLLASGGVVIWSLLAPLGAVVFGDPSRAWRWFAAFVAALVGSEVAAGAVGGQGLDEPAIRAFLALNVGVTAFVVFAVLLGFALQRREALELLGAERERAEGLLLNILPSRIAELLKEDGRTVADQFDSATILFADVVDFTPLSSRLAPGELVELLDHLFSHFDVLADRYRLEKIKTIGDCYMVAAGVPEPRPDHATAIAHMALDMLASMTTHPELAELGLELRIGVNSGPVVGGVIGRKRFIYDLWGDAVNTASRMESQGTPGRIQITEATHELVRAEFTCEPRGTVTVKGKGEMATWYLVGPRDRSVRPAPVSPVAEHPRPPAGGHEEAATDQPTGTSTTASMATARNNSDRYEIE